jgi:glycosyltransferase involved in cell wall biosynthesis
MKPLISCIVPAFNAERYLGEALDSILAQTWRPIEVIVVDDGSTDGTAQVAERYGERIAYIRQANAGPAAARNRGLDAAAGAFVATPDGPLRGAARARALHRPPRKFSYSGHEARK